MELVRCSGLDTLFPLMFWWTQVAGRELLGQHLSGSKYFELGSCGAQTSALWLEAHSWSWFAACEGDPKFGLNRCACYWNQSNSGSCVHTCQAILVQLGFHKALPLFRCGGLVTKKQRGVESVRLEATRLWKTWFAAAVGTQYFFSLWKWFLTFRLQVQMSLGCCYLRNATWKMEKATEFSQN